MRPNGETVPVPFQGPKGHEKDRSAAPEASTHGGSAGQREQPGRGDLRRFRSALACESSREVHVLNCFYNFLQLVFMRFTCV